MKGKLSVDIKGLDMTKMQHVRKTSKIVNKRDDSFLEFEDSQRETQAKKQNRHQRRFMSVDYKQFDASANDGSTGTAK